MKFKKGYLNKDYKDIVNLVIAIIPFTSWILGAVTRIMRGHYVAGLLELIPPITIVFYVIDIVTIIIDKDLRIYA